MFIKRKKSVIIILLVVCLISASATVLLKKRNRDLESIAKLPINPIPMSAAEYELKDVEIDNSLKKKLKKRVCAYRVNPKKYTNKDIKRIADLGLNKSIKQIDESSDEMNVTLSDDGVLIYYEKSGTIKYNSYTVEEKRKEIKKKPSEAKYKNIAESFINKTEVYDLKDLEFKELVPSLQVEYGDDEGNLHTLTYDVVYEKKAPENVAGFEGTGPGIKVSIDAEGEVAGFISVNKEIEEMDTEYNVKDAEEIERDIEKGYNVQIHSESNIAKEIEFKELEYVLYCDPVNAEQQYMIPHYKLNSKNKNNNVEVILPAITNSQLEIKRINK